MKYYVCPNCGAHLDHGERCDCEDKKEDTSAGTEASPKRNEPVPMILTSEYPNVNDCLQLRTVCQSTGAQGKEIALVVRDSFPSFNRQLLTQCQSPEKYGVIIHPEGLRLICAAYGLEVAVTDAEETAASKPKKKPNRKLGRKLTFRMTASDFEKLVSRVDKDGFDSVQAWLYWKVKRLLEE